MGQMSRQRVQEPQRSGVGRVGRELERGVDLAQEEPGAVAAGDQVGVLALPAEAGGLGERLFHDRGGIDEDFDVAARGRGRR